VVLTPVPPLRFQHDDAPAIFAVPNDEANLANCPRLKLYRRSLMKHCAGVTFDLTKNKDLICSLPYHEYGVDAIWSFLFAFQDKEGGIHWICTKETFVLANSAFRRGVFRHGPGGGWC
jgi:hypothetical protein